MRFISYNDRSILSDRALSQEEVKHLLQNGFVGMVDAREYAIATMLRWWYAKSVEVWIHLQQQIYSRCIMYVKKYSGLIKRTS